MSEPLLPFDPAVYEAVTGLRTVRRFRPEPLSDELVRAILDAGRWTGSSKNRQAWAFVVVRQRIRLDRLADCGDFTQPIRRAALVVAPVRLPDGYDWDLGRSSQSMMLAAAALGVGSCPVTLHREEAGKAVLEIPADHGCRFVLAFGYPDDDAERRDRARNALRGRRPLEEIAYEESFAGR